MMHNKQVTFTNESILYPENNKVVMHEWEHPIMDEKAKWICQNGGDILEVGFGMGISATYIQQHNINSHTICEINPQILEKLYKWAEDKPNVIVLAGDWYDNTQYMKTYDGILFDTYDDKKCPEFGPLLPKISNIGCRITWWNNHNSPSKLWNLNSVEHQLIPVNPPENDYFNHKEYLLPKYIYNG